MKGLSAKMLYFWLYLCVALFRKYTFLNEDIIPTLCPQLDIYFLYYNYIDQCNIFNLTRWTNAVLMLAQRLRRWTKIKPVLLRRVMCLLIDYWHVNELWHEQTKVPIKHNTLVQLCFNVGRLLWRWLSIKTTMVRMVRRLVFAGYSTSQ